MEAVRQAGVAATTFQFKYDEETAFLAHRRIFEYAMNGIAPFALTVSFIHPHDPYVTHPEWWDLYDHGSIDLPTTGPADDPHSRRLARGIGMDTDPVTDRQIRDARHAYYANVSYFDTRSATVCGRMPRGPSRQSHRDRSTP